MICAGCGRAIEGRYFTALNRAWHRECFRCAGCGRVIAENKFYHRSGVPYHEQCYHERFSERCAACGRPITGQCTTAMGRKWHPEHFVCAHCHQPFAGRSYYERGGQPYCESCYDQLFRQRCTVCGNPIKGTYYTDHWGNSYCKAHENTTPRCFSCGRLIAQRLTGGGVRFRDGRTMCNLCRKTGIDTPEQGRPVLDQVRRTLATFGLDLGTVSIPLRLGSQSELGNSTRTATVPVAGKCRTTSWSQQGQVIRREVEEILVLHGLPCEHFAATVAHELGHAWVALNVLSGLPQTVEEGLCELAEHLWLRRQGTPEAARRIQLMEQNEDPVYGAGFRAAQRALNGRTPQELFGFVRTNGRLP